MPVEIWPFKIQRRSIGSILVEGIRVIRRRYSLFLGIAAVFAIPLVVTQYALIGPEPNQVPWELMVAFLAISFAAGPLVALAFLGAAVDVYLDRNPSIQSAYASRVSAYLPFLGTIILSLVFVLLATVLLILPGVYVSILWVVVAPIMVIERKFGMEALRSSRRLVKGNWWRCLGVMISSAVLIVVLGRVIGLVAGIVGAGLSFDPSLLVDFVVQTLVTAYFVRDHAPSLLRPALSPRRIQPRSSGAGSG